VPEPLNDATIVEYGTHFRLVKGIVLFKYDDWKLGPVWRVVRTWESSSMSLNDRGEWAMTFTRDMAEFSFKSPYQAVAVLEKVLGHAIRLHEAVDLWEFEHNVCIADHWRGFLLYQNDEDGGYARGWNIKKGRWTSWERGIALASEKCAFPTLEKAWAVAEKQAELIGKEKANATAENDVPGTPGQDQ
jgi:hypothetical protein